MSSSGQVQHNGSAAALSDADIRLIVRSLLHDEADDGRVFEEVGLLQGEARPDFLLVNGSLHGYEIKSDLDTLRRLDNQIRVYSKVLDLVTIVATPRHLPDPFLA